MSEIPGFVWVLVGIFVGVVSLFLGFIKPVELNSFFKFMMFVGIGMLAWGVFKIKYMSKSPEQLKQERIMRHQNLGPREVDINSPQKAHPAQPSVYHKATHGQAHTGAHTAQQPAAHHAQHHTAHPAATNKFCTQCGTPLLKQHKFCPICGNRN